VQHRSRLLLLLPLLVAGLVLPATAQSELDRARELREQIEGQLSSTTGDLEGLEEEIVAVERSIEALDEQDTQLRAELDEVSHELTMRARAAYMSGGGGTFEAMISGEEPGDAIERASLLEALAMRDAGTLESAAALRTRLDQTRELREGRVAELAQLRATLETEVTLLNQRLEEAAGQVRTLELKARRQREVRAAFMNGIYSCPVGNPVFFVDTWGAGRSGGRSHQGVDMMAPHGTPIYAIHAGRVTRMKSGGLGGIVLYMYGDDGNEYYYAHLQGYAAGVGVGGRVEAGDLIGYNGSTGNASSSAPHLHFEVHPGGGRAVNPYPYTARACGR